MTLKDAFDIHQRQTESAHKLWPYFSAVSLAILGYTIGSNKVNWSPMVFLFIGISYLCFALGNLSVLRSTQSECVQAAAVTRKIAKLSPGPEKDLVVTSLSVCKVIPFHVFLSAVVVANVALSWHEECVKAVCPKPASAGAPTKAANPAPERGAPKAARPSASALGET